MATGEQRETHVIDATDQPLGRLASSVAKLLIGKHKPTFTPNVDDGDFVQIKNAGRIKLTGKKREQKVYKWHTGYLGGLKERKLAIEWERDPALVIKRAVKNMLPKNRHQTARLRRLRVTV